MEDSLLAEEFASAARSIASLPGILILPMLFALLMLGIAYGSTWLFRGAWGQWKRFEAYGDDYVAHRNAITSRVQAHKKAIAMGRPELSPYGFTSNR